jgi:hypothetical protein
MDLSRVADVLIDKIKKDYRDDIALVVIMGSYVYKDTHSKSDLDLYFVPKTGGGRNLGMVFIIDGIGFDFWPISWERLEGIADHNERITSIITRKTSRLYMIRFLSAVIWQRLRMHTGN